MSDVRWIKIVTDIFDDEKILLIETLPEADSIIVIWFKLLCLATLKNSQGILEYKPLPPSMTLTDEILDTLLHRKSTSKHLRILELNGFIKRNPKSILVFPFWHDRHDRGSARYRCWRNEVFERDNYICQECGLNKNIQAHHIISWEKSRDKKALRYLKENGITLCRGCHLKAHGGSWRT